MKRTFLLFLSFLLISVSPVRAAENPVEKQAASALPDRELQDLAKQTLLELVRLYQNHDVSGFMSHVAENFRSSDGKTRLDLENSLTTDGEELFIHRLAITSFDRILSNKEFPRKVTLDAAWNRTADVDINYRRKRWIAAGKTEFTFILESEADFDELQKQQEEGKPMDFSKIRWDLKLSELRGDLFFGQTDVKGALFVTPQPPLKRSTLEGARVTAAIPVGETARSSQALLVNRTVTLLAGGGAIDFSSGQVGTTATVTEADLVWDELTTGLFTTSGTARIAAITFLGPEDFNEYNKDTQPGLITTTASTSVIYLVKTREGKYAKFILMAPAGAANPATIKYAFQPNGSGNLASQ